MTDERAQHRRAWPATILLATAAMIASADRVLPNLLMEPIKHAMALSDTQMGMLTGFSFAISMSLAALPLAWLADRYDRTLILACAIAAWCLLTIASGFAWDFTSLFVCRLGVGIGEAALVPASLSLIGDLFPVRRVATASAILVYAATLGVFAGMAGGGAVYEAIHAAAVAGTLSLAPEDAWRWTTIAFGATGLVVALLVALILPEPRRNGPKQVLPVAKAAGFPAYLRQASPFVLPYLLSASLFGIVIVGFNGWLAPFFSRTYGWSIGEVGRILGTVSLIGGLMGPAVGVAFLKLVRRRLGREAPVIAICAMLAVVLPFVLGAPFLPNGLWAAAAIGLVSTVMGGCGIATSVIYVSIAPSHLRARVTATFFFIAGVVGSTGPVVYAGFTDVVLRDPSRLYITMSLLTGMLILVSIVAGLFADRRYQSVVTRAADEVHPSSRQEPVVMAH